MDIQIKSKERVSAHGETIINKSEHVRSVKREKGDDVSPREKKRLTEEEKEYRDKRKEIQKKLIKFATRIPVFMYLTDYREYCLKDVIEQLEPELIKSLQGKYMVVEFADRESKFLYPDAFENGYFHK